MIGMRYTLLTVLGSGGGGGGGGGGDGCGGRSPHFGWWEAASPTDEIG